jgi:hypothetical protein
MYPLMYAWFTPMVSFSESGLPAGTSWSINLDGINESATAPSLISFPEVNGATTFGSFTVGLVPGYQPAYTSGGLMESGTSFTIAIPFTQVTYPVNFTESGLPAGTTWSITIGANTVTSTQPWLIMDEPNGTWTYTVGSVAGYSSTGSGLVTVSAGPTAVSVTYAQIMRALYFNETGLPSGTSWSVTIGASTLTTTGTSIAFSLPEGYLYTYTLGGVPGYTTTWTGGVSLSGTALSVGVAFFPVKYGVTFSETGLASGTTWTLALDGTAYVSSTASMGFTLGNGTYGYVPGNVAGYITPDPGALTVAGLNTTMTLVYTPVTPSPTLYTVAVTESGLPSGTLWSATVGSTTVDGTAPVLLLYEPNGTYAVSTSATGYEVQGPSNVHVAGADKIVSFAFSLPPAPTYAVTLTETGLPSGTAWYATLGSETLSSLTSAIVFNVVNGTYAFTAGSSAAYTPAPASGNLVVDGAAQGMTIGFTAVTPPTPTAHYAVAVTETGLSAGVSWSATLGNDTLSGTGTTLVFELQNGTYAFSTTASGYSAAAPTKVVVDGADQVVSVGFTLPSPAVYQVTFTETGLPAGTTWFVSLGETIYSSTSTALTFSVANGTYAYTIGTTDGYTPSPASGQEVVSGAAVSATVTFTAPSSGGTTTNGAPVSEVYGLVAGLILLALLAVVGWIMYMRKGSKPSGGSPGGPKGDSKPSDDASGKPSTPDGEKPKA